MLGFFAQKFQNNHSDYYKNVKLEFKSRNKNGYFDFFWSKNVKLLDKGDIKIVIPKILCPKNVKSPRKSILRHFYLVEPLIGHRHIHL